MKAPLLALLLLFNGLHLDALRLSPAAVSEAFYRHSYCGRDTIRAFDKNNTKKWSRSSLSTQSSFVAPSFRSQNNQHLHNNDARLLGRKYITASSIAPNQNAITSYLHASSSIIHHATNSSTQQQVTTLSLLCYALNRIRQFMVYKWSQALKLFRILTITSILLCPSIASSSSSLEYYLQNNPHQTSTQLQTQQRSEVSIQTQSSQPYSNSNTNTVLSRRQYPQTTRFVKRKTTTTTQTQKVKRTTLLIMLLTLAASSFRASLRKSKVARTTTPFGIIRNVSPLGNGVSVIRVCMALKFDNNDEIDKDKAKSLLNKLYLEEKELYTKISMLSQDPQVQLNGAYSFRQQALGRYLSNVASTFLQYTNHIRYGSMESIRVPFVEDAVKEFRQVAKDERQVFATTMANQKKKMSETIKKKQQQQQEEEVRDDTSNSNGSNSKKRKSGYILTTILLSIKGDRTSVPLPFGILRQRDVGRALSRIVTDAKVEDCLVASEINWVPNLINPITGNHDVADVLLSEKDVLKAFPDLVSLT